MSRQSASNVEASSAWSAASSIGVTTSTRWSRLRGIRSALPMKQTLRSPASKAKRRLCSRKRPSTLRTRMCSLSPGTPGRSEQTPRTSRSIRAPASDAA